MSTQPENKITGRHAILFAICFSGVVFAGVISTLMSTYLPVAVKDLMGEKDTVALNTVSAYINAVFIFGTTLGGIVTGLFCDKAGRKAAVIFSIACYSLFTILTAYMTAWPGVVICRFCSGFGLGAVLLTTNIIMLEEWPQKSRAVFIGILSIAMPVGIFSAGAIDYFVSSWRQAFMVGFIPFGIAIAAYWLLAESEKWRNREMSSMKQTGSIMALFAKDNRRNIIFGSVIFGSMLIGLWAIFLWLPTWLHHLITTGNGQKEGGISMMMFGIGGLAGGFVSGWVANRAGMRKSILFCFITCGVLAVLLFKTNTSFSPVIYVEIITLAFAFGMSQGIFSVYIPALFPVNIRGIATGFCFNTGRVFTAVAVLFVGVLEKKLGGYGNALFIFSTVFFIGLLVTLISKDVTGSQVTS